MPFGRLTCGLGILTVFLRAPSKHTEIQKKIFNLSILSIKTSSQTFLIINIIIIIYVWEFIIPLFLPKPYGHQYHTGGAHHSSSSYYPKVLIGAAVSSTRAVEGSVRFVSCTRVADDVVVVVN
jgi:hypothetical protein